MLYSSVVIDINIRIPESLPLPEEKQDEFRQLLRIVPEIYEQAKINLTEGAKDFAIMAIRSAKEESDEYHNFADRLAEYHPDLAEEATRAQEAVEGYGLWIEENLHCQKNFLWNRGRKNISSPLSQNTEN